MQGDLVDEWGNPLPGGQPPPAQGGQSGQTPLATAAELRAIGWSDTDIAGYYAKFGFGGGAPAQMQTPSASDDELRAIGWSDVDIAAYRARYGTGQQAQPTGGGTGGGGGEGQADITAPFTGTWNPPSPQALPQVPTYNAPARPQAPEFRYDPFNAPAPFQAPDKDAMLRDPGYQARADRQEKAFLGNRAAQQTLHTGGALKDFGDYAQNSAAQEYANVWNRDYQAYNTNFNNSLATYGANRANAVGNYNTNYQTQYVDPWNMESEARQQEYAPQLLGWQTGAANTQHNNDVNNTNSFNEFLQRYKIFDDQRKFKWDTAFQYATA